MSLAQYSDLTTAVATWLHRSDLTSSIPDFVTLAEIEVMRKMRTRDMETAFSGTITSTGTLAIPANFIAFKELYVNASTIQYLERRSPKWIRDKYAFTGSTNLPRYYAREGTAFIFGPQPDATYTLGGVFYKNRGPLSTNTTHATFVANPDVYLYATLLQSAPYLKNDPRIAVWAGLYQARLDSANGLMKDEEGGGSELRVMAA